MIEFLGREGCTDERVARLGRLRLEETLLSDVRILVEAFERPANRRLEAFEPPALIEFHRAILIALRDKKDCPT